MKAKEIQALLAPMIGKRIQWESGRHCSIATGTLEAVRGKNLLIDGDWKWFPTLHNLKEADKFPAFTPPQAPHTRSD